MSGPRPPNSNVLDPITLSRPLNVNASRNIELPERPLGKQLLSELSKKVIDNELIIRLLDRGASLKDKDKDGNTALHLVIIAAKEGNIQVSTAILIANSPMVDVNAKNNEGKTPLRLTVDETNGITKVLLAQGASIDAKNRDDKSALDEAIVRGDIAKAVLLIQAGATITESMREKLENVPKESPWYPVRQAMPSRGGRRRKTRKARKTRKNRKQTHKKN